MSAMRVRRAATVYRTSFRTRSSRSSLVERSGGSRNAVGIGYSTHPTTGIVDPILECRWRYESVRPVEEDHSNSHVSQATDVQTPIAPASTSCECSLPRAAASNQAMRRNQVDQGPNRPDAGASPDLVAGQGLSRPPLLDRAGEDRRGVRVARVAVSDAGFRHFATPERGGSGSGDADGRIRSRVPATCDT